MTNKERLKLEIQQSGFAEDKFSILLQENSLDPEDEYNPSSIAAKRAIYQTALSCLEAIANNPKHLADRKFDDMHVADFAESLQNRIDQLERKICQLPSTDSPEAKGNTFMLFNS